MHVVFNPYTGVRHRVIIRNHSTGLLLLKPTGDHWNQDSGNKIGTCRMNWGHNQVVLMAIVWDEYTVRPWVAELVESMDRVFWETSGVVEWFLLFFVTAQWTTFKVDFTNRYIKYVAPTDFVGGDLVVVRTLKSQLRCPGIESFC